MANSGKKYGLIIPSKKKIFTKSKLPAARPSMFCDESSSDEDAHKEVNSQIHKEAIKKIMQKQTQIEIQKALEQDATVYEYDSIYDDLKEQNKVKIPDNMAKADKQRKPKYITHLLKAANKREKERERREERKIQKEREKEGDEFDDKPEFVTAAYKKKMQERQEEIEQEKRMDAIEEALDVKKQKDLSGFYRHFLKQQMGEDKASNGNNIEEAKEVPKYDQDADTDLSFSSESEEETEIMKDHKQSKNRGKITKSDNGNRSWDCNEKHEQVDLTVQNSRDERKSSRVIHGRDSGNRHSSRSPSYGQSKIGSKTDRYYSKRNSRSRSPHHRSKDEKKRARDSPRSRSPPSRSKNRTEISSRDIRKQDNDEFPRPTNFATVGPELPKKETSFAKRTDNEKALSARERYLARKAAQAKKPTIEPDSD